MKRGNGRICEMQGMERRDILVTVLVRQRNAFRFILSSKDKLVIFSHDVQSYGITYLRTALVQMNVQHGYFLPLLPFFFKTEQSDRSRDRGAYRAILRAADSCTVQISPLLVSAVQPTT